MLQLGYSFFCISIFSVFEPVLITRLKTVRAHNAVYSYLSVQGSFGQVVRALDRATKTQVAIKIIKSRSAFTKQAQTEISLLKFLRL